MPSISPQVQEEPLDLTVDKSSNSPVAANESVIEQEGIIMPTNMLHDDAMKLNYGYDSVRDERTVGHSQNFFDEYSGLDEPPPGNFCAPPSSTYLTPLWPRVHRQNRNEASWTTVPNEVPSNIPEQSAAVDHRQMAGPSVSKVAEPEVTGYETPKSSRDLIVDGTRSQNEHVFTRPAGRRNDIDENKQAKLKRRKPKKLRKNKKKFKKGSHQSDDEVIDQTADSSFDSSMDSSFDTSMDSSLAEENNHDDAQPKNLSTIMEESVRDDERDGPVPLKNAEDQVDCI